MEGKYSIQLFKIGGERAGIETILARHDQLKTARTLYQLKVAQHPGRLIVLCEGASVLARSDRPGDQA